MDTEVSLNLEVDETVPPPPGPPPPPSTTKKAKRPKQKKSFLKEFSCVLFTITFILGLLISIGASVLIGITEVRYGNIGKHLDTDWHAANCTILDSQVDHGYKRMYRAIFSVRYESVVGKAAILYNFNSGFTSIFTAQDQQEDHPIGATYPCYIPLDPYNYADLGFLSSSDGTLSDFVLLDFTDEDAESLVSKYTAMFWGAIAMWIVGGPLLVFALIYAGMFDGYRKTWRFFRRNYD